MVKWYIIFWTIKDPALGSKSWQAELWHDPFEKIEYGDDRNEIYGIRERVSNPSLGSYEDNCEPKRCDPKSQLLCLKQLLNCFNIVFEAALQAPGDFESSHEQKEADPAYASDKNMARKEANESPNLAFSHQEECKPCYDRAERVGNNGRCNYLSKTGSQYYCMRFRSSESLKEFDETNLNFTYRFRIVFSQPVDDCECHLVKEWYNLNL